MRTGTISIPLCIFLALITLACASKKEDMADNEHPQGSAEEGRDWREMDAFHVIMAETFHPFKDSSNLEPAKARAGELVSAADRWVSSERPAGADGEEINEKLHQLKSRTEALAESVRMDDDRAIGQRLNELHDTFHELQEAWYGGH